MIHGKALSEALADFMLGLSDLHLDLAVPRLSLSRAQLDQSRFGVLGEELYAVIRIASAQSPGAVSWDGSGPGLGLKRLTVSLPFVLPSPWALAFHEVFDRVGEIVGQRGKSVVGQRTSVCTGSLAIPTQVWDAGSRRLFLRSDAELAYPLSVGSVGTAHQLIRQMAETYDSSYHLENGIGFGLGKSLCRNCWRGLAR